VYSAELEIDPEGHAVLHYAQPDSGTNHGTSMSTQVGEILGFTTLDHMRVIWAIRTWPRQRPAGTAGLTTQLQAEPYVTRRTECARTSQTRVDALKVDAANCRFATGVISATDDAKKENPAANWLKENKGSIHMTGKCPIREPSEEP